VASALIQKVETQTPHASTRFPIFFLSGESRRTSPPHLDQNVARIARTIAANNVNLRGSSTVERGFPRRVLLPGNRHRRRDGLKSLVHVPAFFPCLQKRRA